MVELESIGSRRAEEPVEREHVAEEKSDSLTGVGPTWADDEESKIVETVVATSEETVEETPEETPEETVEEGYELEPGESKDSKESEAEKPATATQPDTANQTNKEIQTKEEKDRESEAKAKGGEAVDRRKEQVGAPKEHSAAPRVQAISEATGRPPTGSARPPARRPTRSWLAVPGPVARLFQRFPLHVYPPAPLPASSPTIESTSWTSSSPTQAPSSKHAIPKSTMTTPVLYCLSTGDSADGRRCLHPASVQWQTLLRVADVPHQVRSANHHAASSPSAEGSLPFLFLPGSAQTQSTAASVVPASQLLAYAWQEYTRQAQGKRLAEDVPGDRHTPLQLDWLTLSLPPSQRSSLLRQFGQSLTTATSGHSRDIPRDVPASAETYAVLLQTTLRAAYLYAVYLSPANEPVMRRDYLDSQTQSTLLRLRLRYEVQRAARREIVQLVGGTTSDPQYRSLSSLALGHASGQTLYEEAEATLDRFVALMDTTDSIKNTDNLKDNTKDTDHLQDHEKAGFLFGAPHATLLDALLFSYTHLLLRGDTDSSEHTDSPRDTDSRDTDPSKLDEAHRGWPDDRLPRLVRARPSLVAHHQLMMQYWTTDGRTPTNRN